MKPALVWLGVAGLVTAWQEVIAAEAFLGLYGIAAMLAAAATIVTSLGIIGVGVRRALRWFRKIGRAITTILGLDEKLDEHRDESRDHWALTQQRFDEGSERVEKLERRLEVLASAERAAISGAIAASHAPRVPRSTDPGIRTGWRE